MNGISRTVLREQVKDLLLQRIASGELKPGERLVETRIAAELGTSQAPVREALRDLELLRLVESEPFKGSRVRAFGNAELVEVYPVRAVLEELAAKEATKKLAGDVSALEAEVEAMREAARRGCGQSDPGAVLEVARSRGTDHDHALWHLDRAAGGCGAPRAAARGDPVAQARGRRPRRAQARRGVRADRERPARLEGHNPLTSRSTTGALAGLFLAALALRPQVVGVGPLIDDIQDDLGTSHA